MTMLSGLTLFHTALSLCAIMIGAAAMVGLFQKAPPKGLAESFMLLAGATSGTGFLFPFKGLTPPVVTGFVALAVLALVLLARYRFWTVRGWRRTYAAGMVVSLYLLVFVGVVQAFLKLPALHSLAPTQSELPFVVAQLTVLLAFTALAVAAAIRVETVATGWEKTIRPA